MKTVMSIAILIAFSVSGFAGTGMSASQSKMTSAKKADRKMCYTLIGSGIPQPCDRFVGPIPTTAFPVDIIGKSSR